MAIASFRVQSTPVGSGSGEKSATLVEALFFARLMNHTVYFDPSCSDDERRQRLYDGQLFVYSPRPSTLALCAFARGLIEESFGPVEPRTAQHHMDAGQYAEILGRLKPAFIHHAESKRHIQAMLAEIGCDPEKPISMSRACAARRATDTSRRGSPMRGTRTATRGTPRHPARSTGGCRFTTSRPTTRWRSTRGTSRNQSPTRRLATTTTSGTSRTGAATSRSTRSRILDRCRSPLDRSSSIRKSEWYRRSELSSCSRVRNCTRASRTPRASLDSASIFEPSTSMTSCGSVGRATSTPSAPERRCATTFGPRILARLPDDAVSLYDDESAGRGKLVYASAESPEG